VHVNAYAARGSAAHAAGTLDMPLARWKYKHKSRCHWRLNLTAHDDATTEAFRKTILYCAVGGLKTDNNVISEMRRSTTWHYESMMLTGVGEERDHVVIRSRSLRDAMIATRKEIPGAWERP
jgi:hypothetical protein